MKVEQKRANETPKPKTYIMKSKDNLWKIAKEILGDGNRCWEIQKLNGIKDSELRKLPIGKVIKLS